VVGRRANHSFRLPLTYTNHYKEHILLTYPLRCFLESKGYGKGQRELLTGEPVPDLLHEVLPVFSLGSSRSLSWPLLSFHERERGTEKTINIA